MGWGTGRRGGAQPCSFKRGGRWARRSHRNNKKNGGAPENNLAAFAHGRLRRASRPSPSSSSSFPSSSLSLLSCSFSSSRLQSLSRSSLPSPRSRSPSGRRGGRNPTVCFGRGRNGEAQRLTTKLGPSCEDISREAPRTSRVGGGGGGRVTLVALCIPSCFFMCWS